MYLASTCACWKLWSFYISTCISVLGMTLVHWHYRVHKMYMNIYETTHCFRFNSTTRHQAFHTIFTFYLYFITTRPGKYAKTWWFLLTFNEWRIDNTFRMKTILYNLVSWGLENLKTLFLSNEWNSFLRWKGIRNI